MDKKKTAKRLALALSTLLAAVYIIESLAVSLTLRGVVMRSYDSCGADNPCGELAADGIYKRMCFRNGYLISTGDEPGAAEMKKFFGPLTYHWFAGGRSVYWYSYEIYDGDGRLAGGSWDVPVSVGFSMSGSGLRFTDYYEAP